MYKNKKLYKNKNAFIILSVIIPMYNCEKYILRCLESISQIRRTDIEIIIIDDGSDDKSAYICEEFKKKDQRIKLIKQQNEGVSRARNLGLLIARGQWVTFIDSDDYINNSIYEMCISKLNNNMDLFLMGSTTSTFTMSKKSKLFINDIYKFTQDDINIISIGLIDYDEPQFKKFKKLNIDFGSPCSKFYKRSIIRGENFFFPEHIKIGEDKIFNYIYLTYIRNAFYTTGIAYNYFQNNQSVMNSYSSNKHQLLFEYVKYFKSIVDDENVYFKSIWQLGIRQYLYALKLEFCHPLNKKKYRIRKCQARELRNSSIVKDSFLYGNLWALRPRAFILGLLAKHNIFIVYNFLLKFKYALKLKFK